MNILALETSGATISVALQIGEEILELVRDCGFRHIETLMPAIAALTELAGISPDELDLAACSAGPGSFTALRIGMATAKGIARGANCAIKAVPTLPLLAAGRDYWPGIVMPVMDARKNRVYAAAFRNGKRLEPDSDVPLDEFLERLPPEEPILATGPGAALAAGYPKVTIDPQKTAGRGRAMIETARQAFLAEGSDPPDLGPIYIRLSEAEETLENQG